MVATATRSGCGGQGKADLEIKEDLGENKIKVLGDGEGDLEVEGQGRGTSQGQMVDKCKGEGKAGGELKIEDNEVVGNNERKGRWWTSARARVRWGRAQDRGQP